MDIVGFVFAIIALPEKELKKFTCFMCHLIFRDPVQSQLCGHRFCRKCHETYLRENQKRVCPQCEVEDPENAEDLERGQVFVDRAFKRECDKLPAKCLEQGCSWTGYLGSYEEHERVCEFKAVKCDACGKMVVVSIMDKHKTDECPEAMINCKKCGKAMLKRTIQGAAAGDARCVISGCAKMVPLKNMEAHKREQVVDHVDRINELVVSVSSQVEHLSAKLQETAASVLQLKQNSPNLGSTGASARGPDDAVVAGVTTGNAQLASRAMEKAMQLESVCTVMNTEFKRCLIEIKALSAECTEQKSRAERLELDVKSLERQLMIKDVTLAEQDMRVQMLENAFYDGVLVWKLNEFTRRRQEALMQKTNSIYSSPFFTSRTGYKLCARIYLNGDGMGKNSHISLFIVVMKGPYDALLRWPFQQKVTLTIIDQAGKDHVVDAFQPDTASSSFKRPTSDMNIASGCPLFMPLSYLDMKDRNYVKDDCMFVKVVVDTRDLNA